jgi:LysM repeat protein
MEEAQTPRARVLALAALAVAFVVMVIVIAVSLVGTGGSGDKHGGGGGAQTQATPRTYTVKEGDNLSAISQRYSVPPDVLRQLNPNLDPQALVPGQQVKLR